MEVERNPYSLDNTEPAESEYLNETEFLNHLTDRIRSVKKKGTKVISLIGGAGSGKTTLAAKLCELLGSAETLGTDDYVIGTREERRELENNNTSALLKYDQELLNRNIVQICNLQPGERLLVPEYHQESGLAIAAPKDDYKEVGRADYLIIEGDFDFVRNPDLIIYFEVPDAVRLQNRIKRDTQDRGEPDHAKVIDNFEYRQRSQHIPHTLPAKEKSDIIVCVKAEETINGIEYKYQIENGR